MSAPGPQPGHPPSLTIRPAGRRAMISHPSTTAPLRRRGQGLDRKALRRRSMQPVLAASVATNRESTMDKCLIAAPMLDLAMVLAPIAGAQAAELKVLAGGSMTVSLNALAPQFEKATGNKLVIHFDSTPNLIKAVTSGEPFDLGVVPVDVMKDAAARAGF